MELIPIFMQSPSCTSLCNTTPLLTLHYAQATGNLGPAILDKLINAGFQVTVLTRESSNHVFPTSVTVARVDYDSLDSLVDALKGQDALVSTLASTALSKQLLLVEAAAKAHVKRFIPSEFGSNTLHPKTAALPVFGDKVAVQEALKKHAASGHMSYTLICGGPFFDWGMKIGWIMNLKGKSIVLYDGGERHFSTTTLPTIGKAVVGVLKHPEETKNRAVYVQDTTTTLKKLVEKGKKATGGIEGWTEIVVSIEELLDQAWAELKTEKPNPENFVMKFINASTWGEGYGNPFPKIDNDLLGIKEMTDAEVQALVDSLAK
jgi:nucleoside-diphosphate-sugar epimerase